jgi:hypothetical protein
LQDPLLLSPLYMLPIQSRSIGWLATALSQEPHATLIGSQACVVVVVLDKIASRRQADDDELAFVCNDIVGNGAGDIRRRLRESATSPPMIAMTLSHIRSAVAMKSTQLLKAVMRDDMTEISDRVVDPDQCLLWLACDRDALDCFSTLVHTRSVIPHRHPERVESIVAWLQTNQRPDLIDAFHRLLERRAV